MISTFVLGEEYDIRTFSSATMNTILGYFFEKNNPSKSNSINYFLFIFEEDLMVRIYQAIQSAFFSSIKKAGKVIEKGLENVSCLKK